MRECLYLFLYSCLLIFLNCREDFNNNEDNKNMTNPHFTTNFSGIKLPQPFDYVLAKLRYVFYLSIDADLNITQQCRDNILFALEGNNEKYLYKFIQESAPNKNDVETYFTCNKVKKLKPIKINNSSYSFNLDNDIEYLKNLTYVILQVNKKLGVLRSDIRFVSGRYLLGICIIKGCTEEDYSNLFYRLNYEMNDPLKIVDKDEILVYNIDETEVNYDYLFLNIIPVYLIVIQLIFTFFPSMPAFIFTCCFKKPKKEKSKKISNSIVDRVEDKKYTSNLIESDDEEEISLDHSQEISFVPGKISDLTKKMRQRAKSKLTDKSKLKEVSGYDEQKIYEFKTCFNISENTEDFFSLKSSKGNDSGMSNLRGLRGFTMIFMIIGHIYVYLLVSPLKIYSEFQHKNLITSAFYGIILFGMRYAPRVLIGCSGFSLIYKLLCYLDEIVENSSELNETSININVNSNCNQIPQEIKSMLNKDQDLFSNTTIREEYKELKLIHLLRFILYQGYKYLLFILFVCYFKFSFYDIVNLFITPSPMWVYLKKNIIDKMTNWDFLGTLLLFHPYTCSDSETLNIFWIAESEITFFILTTVIVFICYKKNFRMDWLFLILYILLFSYKIYFYFYLNIYPILYPALGNYTDRHASFYQSPIYNYTFFITGVFFGMVNYVIQKSVNENSIKSSGKKYLKFPMYFVKFYKENRSMKVIAITVLGLAIILFMAMSYPILYTLIGKGEEDPYLELFNSHKELNLFYLLDTELFIIILMTVFTSLFILGDNFFVDFFSHDYWSFISRSYYSFILICDIMIIYIFYQSETRIKLEIFNILFFSLFTVSCIVCSSIFIHITLETPYKKLSKNLWTVEHLEKNQFSFEESPTKYSKY
jgi:hypothetical protein